MTGYRSPVSLQAETWLREHGLLEQTIAAIEDAYRTNDETLRAWDTLPTKTQQTAIADARQQRDNEETFLLELIEGTHMTTIRTSTVAEGQIGALKWRHTEVAFAYDPQLTELLKKHIPAEFRDWNPQRKIWTIKGVYYIDAFLRTAKKRGHDVLEPIERGL